MKSKAILFLTGLFLTVSFLAARAVAQEKTDQSEPNKAGAVGCIRTVNTAEYAYASTYHTGFSRTMAALGMTPGWKSPTPEAAGLIDEKLTTGKHSGYVFTYKVGAKDADGKTNTYALAARPIKWYEGIESFFTDQTGVIRWTRENRAATVKDPPIE